MSFPLILAIDTSCDDSSASVVSGRTIISNVIYSQKQHQAYGGVFPTLAKQEHLKNIHPAIEDALNEADVTVEELDAIAVTQGPGLAPSLEVGITAAKELALRTGLPLIAVNHLEGHLLSPLAVPSETKKTNAKTALLKQHDHFFSQKISDLEFPLLSIVVSGGNTDFVLVEKIGKYVRLGYTVDDAAGEALDKFGRLLDLPYPAGPEIERRAKHGDAKKYPFPVPMTTSGNFLTSFSGLKTSVKTVVEELKAHHALSEQEVSDLCASFQHAVFRAITYKLGKIQEKHHFSTVFLGGGVASNMALRAAIENELHLPLYVPYSKKLCVDNAAMIGLVANLKWERDEILHSPTDIQAIERKPNWTVDQL